ncbi:MAG: hypothetical protein ABWX96_20480, partial [Propionibacteriaceae bacterium]
MRITPTTLIVLILTAVSVVAVTAPQPAAAAAPNCGLFTARMYDQLNPTTSAQTLSARGDQATAAYDNGFTAVRPNAISASLSAGTSVGAVHKLYQASSRNYFYSLNAAEIRTAVTRLGYQDQGVVFYAATQSSSCLVPVYSFFRLGKHRYVTSAAERAELTTAGWKPESVRFHLGRPASAFTFAVIPDTQQEVLAESDRRFVNRSQWLRSTT